MPNVISNTSCLIALSNIAMLGILQKRYDRIIITPEVANEFGVRCRIGFPLLQSKMSQKYISLRIIWT
jgi:predicted nucleic acid-binding protein